MKKSRRKKLERNPDGTFKRWKGGQDIEDLPDKDRSNAHGVAVHLGKEYKRQHGHTADTGDIVRTKTKDGTYHKQASWYVMTPHGWRESPTKKKKPTKREIARICDAARPGRPAQKPGGLAEKIRRAWDLIVIAVVVVLVVAWKLGLLDPLL